MEVLQSRPIEVLEKQALWKFDKSELHRSPTKAVLITPCKIFVANNGKHPGIAIKAP